MSEKPISPLRQRMLEDMSLRGFTPDTQRDYIRAVKKLAAFLGRSPDTATAEDLRAFQLHLSATGVQPPTINAMVTVLRFFFKVTLDRPETTRHLVFVYAGSLEAVPPVDAHQAGGSTRRGQAAVLRRPRASHRRQSIRRVPRPAQKDALVRLCQAPVRQFFIMRASIILWKI